MSRKLPSDADTLVGKYRIAEFDFSLFVHNEPPRTSCTSELLGKLFYHFAADDVVCPPIVNVTGVRAGQLQQWPLTGGRLTLIQNNGSASFFFSGLMVDNPLTENPALYEAEAAVINYVTSQLKQKIWIHGACLVRDSKIVLLIAPTGTGKTTLSLGLLGHGFKLLTDDVIIINPVEKTVLPYPRCPKIRTPAEVQLNEMGLTVVKDSEVIGNFLILPESFIEKSAQNLVDKEIYVFFLSREEVLNHDTPLRIDYCRAMIELLRHSNLLYQDKQLKGSHHLLSKTAFYNLYINSLQENLQQILSIASN